jgi:hypothetical protein
VIPLHHNTACVTPHGSACNKHAFAGLDRPLSLFTLTAQAPSRLRQPPDSSLTTFPHPYHHASRAIERRQECSLRHKNGPHGTEGITVLSRFSCGLLPLWTSPSIRARTSWKASRRQRQLHTAQESHSRSTCTSRSTCITKSRSSRAEPWITGKHDTRQIRREPLWSMTGHRCGAIIQRVVDRGEGGDTPESPRGLNMEGIRVKRECMWEVARNVHKNWGVTPRFELEIAKNCARPILPAFHCSPECNAHPSTGWDHSRRAKMTKNTVFWFCSGFLPGRVLVDFWSVSGPRPLWHLPPLLSFE